MKTTNLKFKIGLSILLTPFVINAQETDSSLTKIMNLGEVEISTFKKFDDPSRLESKEIQAFNKVNVADALNMVSGVHIIRSGARNESMVAVRGFDSRQIPVYIDGIPVYIPYDGLVDLARFTTADIERIDVSKGFSSIIYGPNSLGGAINLVSSKPREKLEFNGSLGMINNNGYKGDMMLGSRIKKFYFQAGASFLQRDSYVLSKEFVANSREDGGARNNSYNKDWKVNAKIGWTPTENQEYVIGYLNQQGVKGNPVYCGTDTLNPQYYKARYWEWPQWNKETYYFLSNSKLDDKNYIKTRFYFDQFKNSIYSYDDETYTTQKKPSSFQSFYDDYSYGGNIEYGTTLIPKNDFRFAVHYKSDVHREHNLDEPVRFFNDHTISIGLEDVFKVTDKFILIPGFSYSLMKNLKAEDYDSKKQEIFDYPKAKLAQAYNGQLAMYYQFDNFHKIGIVTSAKTRFATLKDRYSYKMGTAIPNPNLNPETAYNMEVNYQGNFLNKINVHSALFYSYISNTIMSISNVEKGKSQMRNAGKAQFYGAELNFQYNILHNLMIKSSYTFLKRENITDPTLLFTDLPEHSVFSMVQYQPLKQIGILVSHEYNSSRFSASYGAKTKEYNLINIALLGEVTNFLRIELGVNNVFDKNYLISEGYPEEGRNFYVTLRFHNLKIK